MRFDLAKADVVLALDVRFPDCGSRVGALRARLRRSPQGRSPGGRRNHHEPSLRRRIEPDGDGNDRRSSAPHPARAGCRHRAGSGRRASESPASRPRRSTRPPPMGRRPPRATSPPIAAPRSSSPATTLPAAAHTLVAAINDALGQRGRDRCSTAPRSRPMPVDNLSLARRAARRDEGRQGRPAADLGGQPGLRRACRPRLRRGLARPARRCGSITASTTTRRRPAASGTCRRRTTSSPGATRGPTTAPSR